MDRVTDEWLREADQRAQELASKKHPADFLSSLWVAALRLAFAQAVARECLRLMDDEIQRLDVAIVATATTDTAQASNNQGHILTRRDALRWAVSQIRARFGLED